MMRLFAEVSGQDVSWPAVAIAIAGYLFAGWLAWLIFRKD